MGTRMRREEVHAAFGRMDEDGNGSVDRSEMVRASLQLRLAVTRAEVDEVILRADSDGDGRISLAEFESFVEEREQELEAAFAAIDRNRDGTIDVGELHEGLRRLKIAASTSEVARIVDALDVDGDGKIDYEEFRRFLLLTSATNIGTLFEYFERGLSIDIGEDMVMPPDASALSSPMVNLVAGAYAGSISRTLTAPLDRLKTQLQAARFGGPGVIEGLRRIYHEGGALGFYRGNGANVIKIAPESAIKFGCFDAYKRLLCRDSQAPTTAERMLAGGAAGATAQIAIYPMEIAKTRIALSKTGEYSGIASCLRTIASQEGPRALYKGLAPALLGIVPYAGVDLAAYAALRDAYCARFPESEPGPLTLLGCGATSSTCGQLVSYPLALVRTRLQAQGAAPPPGGDPSHYSGMVDAFRKILAAEGPRGLYRGLAPNMLKAVPAISVSYLCYESAKSHLES